MKKKIINKSERNYNHIRLRILEEPFNIKEYDNYSK